MCALANSSCCGPGTRRCVNVSAETFACVNLAKVEFEVNDVKQAFPMKLGEGGEAFFVFETTENIPAGMQTSPLASPAASPTPHPAGTTPSIEFPEPTPLDLDENPRGRPRAESAEPPSLDRRAQSDMGGFIYKYQHGHVLTGHRRVDAPSRLTGNGIPTSRLRGLVGFSTQLWSLRD
jgi:hypothetical protein